ncbi:mediator complex subunit 31 [Aphelenchoides avenae]|nr:mediator complex subunit 31 [Aphelenchus avenae]
MFPISMPTFARNYHSLGIHLPPTPNSNKETPEEATRRFEIECEFVQSLANPHYLNYLAQRGYFKEEYFVNYLRYLLYWRRPEYAETLKYPQCLYFLEALQSAEFREAIASAANAKYIEDQQMLQWHFYIRKRQRLSNSNSQKKPGPLRALPFKTEGLWTAMSPWMPKRADLNALSVALLFLSLLSTVVSEEAKPQKSAVSSEVTHMPTKCESCMLFSRELDNAVARLPPKMRQDEAEAWLIDELERICDRMLAFRVHKEKEGLARFSKELSGTVKTIKQLQERGVEVKLDMPTELLEEPSLESGRIKQDCEWFVEEFEKELEEWFLNNRQSSVREWEE